MHPPKFSFPLAAAVLIALNACGDTSTSPSLDLDTIAVEALTPISISGAVGATASPTPSVRVVDGITRKPLANVTVAFNPLTGSGSITNTIVKTDASGIASPSDWHFSTQAGPAYVMVSINGRNELMFTATLKPDVPARLEAAVVTDQASLLGDPAYGPAVIVRDKFSNMVPGVLVSFAVTDGGGTLEKQSDVTATAPIAPARAGSWTLSTSPGHNEATASVAGLAPLVFNAESLDPAKIQWYRLDSLKSGSQAFSLGSWGVETARLGMTLFDSCLCKKQQGFFVDQLLVSDYGGGTTTVSGSGRYVLDGTALTLSSSPNPGVIKNGEVFLQREDPIDFGFVLTWIYTPIIETP